MSLSPLHDRRGNNTLRPEMKGGQKLPIKLFFKKKKKERNLMGKNLTYRKNSPACPCFSHIAKDEGSFPVRTLGWCDGEKESRPRPAGGAGPELRGPRRLRVPVSTHLLPAEAPQRDAFYTQLAPRGRAAKGASLLGSSE